MRPYGFLLAMLTLLACSAEETSHAVSAASGRCRVVQSPTPLPTVLHETSGVALSQTAPGLLWTVNDSGNDPVLHGFRASGELTGSVVVEGAENVDWEDLALGPCPAGDCLYIADIGDNDAERERTTIYRVPEPSPGAGASGTTERYPVRYPDGPRDAEALFVLPGGELFIVTKGRNSAVELYRYPLPLREDGVVDLERVRSFSAGEVQLGDQVTGAGASADGEWVAIRTYTALHLYRADELTGGGEAVPTEISLTGLGEPQGEAVGIREDGTVVLTTEERGGAPAAVSILACELVE